MFTSRSYRISQIIKTQGEHVNKQSAAGVELAQQILDFPSIRFSPASFRRDANVRRVTAKLDTGEVFTFLSPRPSHTRREQALKIWTTVVLPGDRAAFEIGGVASNERTSAAGSR